jgi:diguanylate cyclase (GGDEF)-like protein/PAS domain S-box-containing protein
MFRGKSSGSTPVDRYPAVPGRRRAAERSRIAMLEQEVLRARRSQLTLDSIGDAVLTTDAAGKVTYLNPVAERMTGWSNAEAAGRPLQQVMRIVAAHSREPVPNPLALAMAGDAVSGLAEDCLLLSRDGRELAIEDTAAPIHAADGSVDGAVIVFHDVGAAREMSLRMSHLAQHDVLTGLPNRLLFNDRLERAIEAARRHRVSLAVFFLDLDRFKQVNDSLGHAAGDQVLRSVAARLVRAVRAADTVSRRGGDEFVVLLSEVTGMGDAVRSSNKLLAAIAAPQRIDGSELTVTASLGIAVYPGDGADSESLLATADAAMLRAKSGVARPAG